MHMQCFPSNSLSSQANGVEGAIAEWYVENLSGLPLLHVTPNTDPTHYHYCFLTTALGMPITAKEVVKNVYGSILFFFYENKDKKGNTSNRVLVSI